MRAPIWLGEPPSGLCVVYHGHSHAVQEMSKIYGHCVHCNKVAKTYTCKLCSVPIHPAMTGCSVAIGGDEGLEGAYACHPCHKLMATQMDDAHNIKTHTPPPPSPPPPPPPTCHPQGVPRSKQLYAYLQARADRNAQESDSEDAEVEDGEVEDDLEEGEEVGVLAAHTTGWMRGLTTVRAHYAALCNEMDTKTHYGGADDMSQVGTRICAFNKRQFARGYIVDKHYGEGSDDPLWPIGPGRPHTDEAIALLLVCTRCSYTPNIRTHPNYLPPHTHAPNRRTVRTRLRRRASLRRMLRPRCKRTLIHPTHTNLQQASQP